MRKARSILAVIILCACDGAWAPDMRHKVPDYIPVKELLYAKAMMKPPCTVNVFQVDEGFGTKIEFNDINVRISKKMQEQGGHYLEYQPWQETPVLGKIDEMSAASASLAFSEKCLQDTNLYQNFFMQHKNNKGSYFTLRKGGSLVLIYVPDQNILFLTDWN